MAFTNTPFVDGQIISETDLKGRIDNFEKYVNGGSVSSDLAHGEWVQTHHIYRPDFIGGSNKRGEFCTGTVFYRLHSPDKVDAEVFHQESRGAENGDTWQPVNGLNVTVKAYRPMKMMYMASWLAWEQGSELDLIGAGGALANQIARINSRSHVVADFALFVQKLDQSSSSLQKYHGTNRRLFASVNCRLDQINGKEIASGNGKYESFSKSAGKQMSTHQLIDLSVGVYNVGIRVKPQKTSGDDGEFSQNIFVRPRSCVVNGHFSTAT
jgi:hypothetical protein